MTLHIQLIKPGSHDENTLRDKWYLPIELIWIRTYLRLFGHETEILDGQYLALDEIESQIGAPIVGIGFNVYSVKNLDVVAQAAKKKDSIVVVGGQAATPLAEQILRGNENIDAVVCGDGEEALRQIADAVEKRQDPFANTSNIVYRRNEKIIRNRLEEVPVYKVPIPERRLKGIDIEKYIANFPLTNSFVSFNGKRVTNAHTKKGCPRRCSFCGRIDKKHRARSPQQTFEEYSYLVDDFGIDYIFDHSDTWAVDSLWLEEFRAICERKGGFGARLSIFADIRDLTPGCIENLKAVGVDTIETGIESGDERILSQNNKNMTRAEIFERISRVIKTGIKVEASYVLGVLGETEDSVQNTLDLSRKLHQEAKGRMWNYFNIIMPLPGSPIWQLLINDPVMREKYGSSYVFDMEELQKNYLRRHCNLGFDAYEFLREKRDEILRENGLEVTNYVR